MRIVIVTPAPAGTRHGNRATALRWAGHLRAQGHSVEVATGWSGEPFDAMIALHARRSHAAMAAWRAARGAAPLALVLTGTDLYRDIRSDRTARASLDLADRLVVLQERGLAELSRRHRARAETIHQSVRPVRRRTPPARRFLVTVIGHLRPEKDPFRAALALGFLPQADSIRVVQIGRALDPAAAREARALMRAEPRYRWIGELDHAATMRWLARSHLMVISSLMEGGAHVVSEAIGAGIPVIASRIPGNLGLLGTGYLGYFKTGDAAALARRLARAMEDRDDLARLAAAVRARRALVDPALERTKIARLVRRLAAVAGRADRTGPGDSARKSPRVRRSEAPGTG